ARGDARSPDFITGTKSVYKLLGLGGVAQGGNLCRVDVANGRILRIVPLHYDWEYSEEELRSSRWRIEARGRIFEPRLKELVSPFALVYKNRVYSPNRVRYPLKRVDWSPENPNPQNRGKSKYVRISWDEAIDIVAKVVEGILRRYGDTTPILVQGDGHGQSGFLHTLHFYGHMLFDKLGTGWTQQIRNPDSWEGYYWGSRLAWGFDSTLGEPYQDGAWDDALQNSEVVICSGCDPETTTAGFSAHAS
ncbi:MAG: molybdopterin-dependent oxidoreductase, partial [Conexivisphaera sp.]